MASALLGATAIVNHRPSPRRLALVAVAPLFLACPQVPAEPCQLEQAELDAIEEELREFEKEATAHMQKWARNTSIILIIFATFVMGVSLVRADQLPVISNGLLLGGVFTMLYGTGWTIASGDSLTRFFVMMAALLVTLGLGYVRFVRERAASPVADSSSGVDDLARRVEALERRFDAAAEAMKQP